MASLISEQTTELLSPGHLYSKRTHGSDLGLSALASTSEAMHLNGAIRRDAADLSSENDGALVQSTSTSTSQSGISLFQG